ncbi:hypothetical protein ScPMuIL_014649 [Solemya velum]
MAVRATRCLEIPRASYCLLRYSSTQTKGKTTQKTENIKIESTSPKDDNYDWIGPPDPESNIRPIKFAEPEELTDWERKYRIMRRDTAEWNQKFWAQHNKNFFKQKEIFVEKRLAELKSEVGDKAPEVLSQDEMVVFYKGFLDENYKMHMKYNGEWYERNINLLWPAFKVSTERLKRRLFNWKSKK